MNVYRGSTIPADVLDEYIARAGEQLKQYQRLYDVSVPCDLPDAKERAICAMAEALYSFDMIANGEGGPVQSASVGSVSVSYGNAAAQALDLSPKGQEKELYRCARRYLDIYRGCG